MKISKYTYMWKVKKITIKQAKIIARFFFGGRCYFAGIIPSEPDTVCYLFRRGIFALEITIGENTDIPFEKLVVAVDHETVGSIIDLNTPKGFEFHKTPAAGFNLDESEELKVLINPEKEEV